MATTVAPSSIAHDASKFKSLVQENRSSNADGGGVDGQGKVSKSGDDDDEEEDEDEDDKEEQALIAKQRAELFKHMKEEGTVPGSSPGSAGAGVGPRAITPVGGAGASLLHGRAVHGRHSTAGEFTVTVQPEPVYGLGMKLVLSNKSQPTRTAASSSIVVNSFKKNPSNDETLPVESSGLVHVGDALVAVDDLHLQGLTLYESLKCLKGVLDTKPESVRLTFRHGDAPTAALDTASASAGVVSPPRAPDGSEVRLHDVVETTDASADVESTDDVPIIYPVVIPTEALVEYRVKKEQEEEHGDSLSDAGIASASLRPHAAVEEITEGDEEREGEGEASPTGQAFGASAPLPPIPVEISLSPEKKHVSFKSPAVMNSSAVLPPIQDTNTTPR